ncbi:lipopolysaccharide biosynthesis protein [Pantanalinema sp. GBBB05]|uniref:lipopolysaccharide biosynthesis protein n=1 Tax=Pantanalinema sp. GBBB05 TaxID=2604139 RepID=UPI001D6E7878|nr:oligosaccharide flippase family protein [Pantanalinema sp. GBBB05]
MHQWFADRIFRKSLKNASWLLGGRIFTGAASLVYLGLTTRSLGVTGFGVYVLIQTYIQVIIDLTTFQSSQAVIRYGAICLQQNDKVAFQQLIKFTTLLDLLGALVGFAIAIGLTPTIATYMGWDQGIITQVQWSSLLILFSPVPTPRGLLQLCNRFDLLALQLTIYATVRLIGTIGASMWYPSLAGYLVVWWLAEGLSGLFLIVFGWREAGRQGLLSGIDRSLLHLTQFHPGLLKFCIVSNFHSSLPIVMRQSSPLVIGLIAAPSAVGLFQVSWELSTPLKEIAQLLTQAFYPEFAYLSSEAKWLQLKSLVLKSTAIALGIGILLLGISIGCGQIVLQQVFGAAFVPGYGVFVLLVAAELFAMGSSGLEAALFALGRPEFSLQVNAIVILGVYLPLLLVLTHFFGIIGAGIAALIPTMLILVLESLLTWNQLHRRLSL